MSELWLMLVLLAVSIVFSVVIYNWWQERTFRKTIERHFETSREDVLTAPSTSTPAKSAPHLPLDEDSEGWMSEPRVRGSSKIEPSFMEESAPSQPATFTPDTAGVSAATAHADANDAAVEGLTLAVNQQADEHQSDDHQADDHQADDHQADDHQAAPAIQEDIPPTPTSIDLRGVVPEASTVRSVSDTLFALDFETPITGATPVSDAQVPAAVTASSISVDAPDTNQQSTTSLPAFLHVAIDWVGVIKCPQGVPLVQIADIQTQLASFSQYTSCWLQFAGQHTWQNLLSVKPQQNLDVVCIALALQLADRGGPVDAATIERFRQLLLGLGLQLGGSLHWLHEAPLKQAHDIDAFSIEVDKAVEFHVMALQGMFHATKLRGLAEANGLQLSDQGRFDRINPDGLVAFSIRNFEGKPFSADMLKTAVMTGMTFQLDIPTTPNNTEVFEQMVQMARQFASSLNAELLDVNRKPIAEAQLVKIRQQLTSINASMQSRGITPGAQHARRLFS